MFVKCVVLRKERGVVGEFLQWNQFHAWIHFGVGKNVKFSINSVSEYRSKTACKVRIFFVDQIRLGADCLFIFVDIFPDLTLLF